MVLLLKVVLIFTVCLFIDGQSSRWPKDSGEDDKKDAPRRTPPSYASLASGFSKMKIDQPKTQEKGAQSPVSSSRWSLPIPPSRTGPPRGGMFSERGSPVSSSRWSLPIPPSRTDPPRGGMFSGRGSHTAPREQKVESRHRPGYSGPPSFSQVTSPRTGSSLNKPMPFRPGSLLQNLASRETEQGYSESWKNVRATGEPFGRSFQQKPTFSGPSQKYQKPRERTYSSASDSSLSYLEPRSSASALDAWSEEKELQEYLAKKQKQDVTKQQTQSITYLKRDRSNAPHEEYENMFNVLYKDIPRFEQKYKGFSIKIQINNHGYPYAYLPFKDQNGERVTVSVYVLNSGQAFFTAPILIENVRPILYVDERNNGDCVVEFPFINDRNSITWYEIPVETDTFFRRRLTIEHHFAMYGYFVIPMHAELFEDLAVEHSDYEYMLQLAEQSAYSKSEDYILSINHAASYCISSKFVSVWTVKELCTHKWIIHNFVQDVSGQIRYIRRSKCKVNDDRSSDQRVSEFHITENVRNVWHSISKSRIVEHIDQEWCKHGRYIFDTIDDFLNTTVALFKNINLQNHIDTVIQATHLTNTLPKDYLQAFQSLPTHRATKLYNTIKVSQLHFVISEVKFCFDRNFRYKNCSYGNQAGGIQNEADLIKNQGYIIYPPDDELFPFLFLNIGWVPRRRNSWAVISLCPSLKYERVADNYIKLRYEMADSIVSQLELRSPELINEITDIWIDRWHHQFHDCGLLLYNIKSPNFSDPSTYYRTSNSLFNGLNTHQWNFEDRFYGHDEFIKIVGNIIRRPRLRIFTRCVKDENNENVLARLTFCYDHHFNLIDCPNFERYLIHVNKRRYREPNTMLCNSFRIDSTVNIY